MAELSGLQVFKYLPAAKKLPEGNCKKCASPTCMAFALKLAKGQAEIDLCPYAPEELKELLSQSLKKPQKEVYLGREHKFMVGGENVLYRHDKTFVNPSAIGVVIDFEQQDWAEKLKRAVNFEITRVSDTFKLDFICFNTLPSDEIIFELNKNSIPYILKSDLDVLFQVKETTPFETLQELSFRRKKAVLEKDEEFSDPVYVYFEKGSDPLSLCARASMYICKYANALVFEDFDESLLSTLMTLRQNIFTDPQKPLQVESKVYEFNNVDENALVFLTTNFALTYFAVANEIEALNKPAYLIVTPSDGMSVLTAWSAEKFTAQIAAKTVKAAKLDEKVKNKKIIIPGLLSHMKSELEEEIEGFEILVGPNEAFMLSDFVKTLNS